MKTIITIMAIIFLSSFAGAEIIEVEIPDKDMPESICPFTKMGDSCTSCHEVRKNEDGYVWSVKEEKWRGLPHGTTVIDTEYGEALRFKVESIYSSFIFDVYEYAKERGFKNVLLDISSPGGSVIEAWEIVAMIQEYSDIKTITKCSGLAASAGFVLLASGDHRIASPHAMLMAHELWTMAFLKVETPASSEEQAKTMRMWQDNINEWLAQRSNLTADEITEEMHKRDWWMVGKTAHKLGFVDELMWGDE